MRKIIGIVGKEKNGATEQYFCISYDAEACTTLRYIIIRNIRAFRDQSLDDIQFEINLSKEKRRW